MTERQDLTETCGSAVVTLKGSIAAIPSQGEEMVTLGLVLLVTSY